MNFCSFHQLPNKTPLPLPPQSPFEKRGGGRWRKEGNSSNGNILWFWCFTDFGKDIFTLNAKEARKAICGRKRDPRLEGHMTLGKSPAGPGRGGKGYVIYIPSQCLHNTTIHLAHIPFQRKSIGSFLTCEGNKCGWYGTGRGCWWKCWFMCDGFLLISSTQLVVVFDQTKQMYSFFFFFLFYSSSI
jgi:hypothetical protein